MNQRQDIRRVGQEMTYLFSARGTSTHYLRSPKREWNPSEDLSSASSSLEEKAGRMMVDERKGSCPGYYYESGIGVWFHRMCNQAQRQQLRGHSNERRMEWLVPF